MARPVDAIVTGFTKSAELCEASFAPLRALKRAGVVRRIVYTPGLDQHVAPVEAMSDVDLVRVEEPKPSGTPFQRGVVYQVRNLECALAQIPERDALIVKLRPDFIAKAEFLQRKIADFDSLCAPSRMSVAGIQPPPSPFSAKIWIPWADGSQPFFYEDAACIGLKRDLEALVTPNVERLIGVLNVSENIYGPFAHVARFGAIFGDKWPIFARYLRDYRFFVNNADYRKALVPRLVRDAFFWHLVVAHAWVLAQNFHVDCGRPGELMLFPNIWNEGRDWSSVASLRVNPPFDNVEAWRASSKPGALLPCVSRVYGRLMDDRWQHALFEGPLADLPASSLQGLLRAASLYDRGVLAAAEEGFYRMLADTYRQHWLKHAA
jgi:hypothetical protein